MTLDNIKTSQNIFQFMNDNIDYGWIDYNGDKHLNTIKDFRKMYKTISIDDILKYKLGTCINQVFLMLFLFDKINIKNKMFCYRIFEPDNYRNFEEDEHMLFIILFSFRQLSLYLY